MPSQLTRVEATSDRLRYLTLPPPLRTGPMFVLMLVLDVPVAVVAMASVGPSRWVSALFAGAWFALITTAAYNRWARLALPVFAGVFLVLVIATLPFNSLAFVVDYWTAAVMLLWSAPGRRSRGDADSGRLLS